MPELVVLVLVLLLWVEARAEDRLVTAVLLVVVVVGWLELVLLLDEAEEERNRYRVLSSVVAPVI